MSLRNKVLFILLGITVLSVSLTGLLAYGISKDSLETQIGRYLESVTRQKEARINDWLENAGEHLELLASDPLFVKDLKHLLRNLSPGIADLSEESTRILAHLNMYASLQKFTEVFVLSPEDGQVVLSTDRAQEGKNKKNREYFQEGRSGTFVQSMYYSMTRMSPAMTVSTPVIDNNGELIIVLAARLDLLKLTGIVGEQLREDGSEDTYMVNAQNYFITEPRFGKGFALRKTVYTEGVKSALTGKTGLSRYPDYRNVQVYGAYVFMPKWNVALITEMDESEYLAPIKTLQRAIIVVGTMLGTVATAVGLLITASIFTPLARFIRTIDSLKGGNLDVNLNYEREDEIGLLAEAFTKLSKRLQQTLVSKEILQKEVEKRKEAEAHLTTALTKLSQSNRELEQFAYVASHDLQEPLRMVSSYVQLLAERYRGNLDEKADKFINYAVDGAARMQQLIQDLLSLSRVTTRGCVLSSVDGNIILNRALDNLKAAIAETGARVTHEQLPELLVDSGQMVQLFQNLIGNAIKFHRPGIPPEIHIGFFEAGTVYIIKIRDNGIGIDEKYKEKIFVIFQRLHSREEYPGTGIGLAICKRIMERHNGRIWYESEPGEGTAFFLEFPKVQNDFYLQQDMLQK